MYKVIGSSMLGLAALLPFGLSGTAQAQQVPQGRNMSFFVTSTTLGKGGDLGGLAGADAHCQQLAATAGAGGKTWRAYWRTNAAGQGGEVKTSEGIGNGPWQNSKGSVIPTSREELHSDNKNLGQQNSP